LSKRLPIKDSADKAKWERLQSWGKKHKTRKSFLVQTYNSYYNRKYTDESGTKSAIADRIKTERQFGVKRRGKL
jgi:hypothetical protein